jgi:hypothetical protein
MLLDVTGTSDLDQLLRDMAPTVRTGEFVFVPGDAVPDGVPIEASVREDEGASAVIARSDADATAIAYDLVACWITLTVHSALDAVGLTAAVSGELAGRGISCNVIAGLRHDHLLVPAPRLDEALDALRDLTERAERAASNGDERR